MTKRPSWVKCILDERATNAIILDNAGDYREGVTLCGRTVHMVQLGQPDKEGKYWAECVHYEGTLHLSHWFNHTVSNNYMLGCKDCIEKIKEACMKGVDDGEQETMSAAEALGLHAEIMKCPGGDWDIDPDYEPHAKILEGLQVLSDAVRKLQEVAATKDSKQSVLVLDRAACVSCGAPAIYTRV